MNLEQFYDEEPVRRSSGEVDFGVMWGDWPHRRVSWIKATGEVYAVTQNRAQDPVEVLGVVATREELEARLHGWPERLHDGGLGWIREQLAGAEAPAVAPAALDRVRGDFMATVMDAGGGEVRLFVDRDTLFYPAIGRRVRVVLEGTGVDRPAEPVDPPPLEHSRWPEPLVLRMLLQSANLERPPENDPLAAPGPWKAYKAGPLEMALTFVTDGGQTSSLGDIRDFLSRYFKEAPHPVLEVRVRPFALAEREAEDAIPF